MAIKVMIAEDEKLAREELEYLLKAHSDLILLPSATNGRELLEQYEKHKPDVIFLDIHMPDLDGMLAARQLAARTDPPLIVFTTAYDHYAVEAFRLQAVDYLLKPYSEAQLAEALRRVRAELKRRSDAARNVHNPPEAEPKMDKLLLEDGERLIVVDPAAILYVERDERQVKLHSIHNTYTAKITLNELEVRLKPYHFFRPHRSYLVNLNHVEEIRPGAHGTYYLVVNDAKRTRIPVSRAAAKALLQRFHL
ncbi:MAG: LytTR family DNA-binding domain-containing protein [Calditerricola sp.]|nr:LytTR family DNA-binding domain-containing protein [Calditerricola sp.]